MEVPIRCFTCGKIIGHLFEQYSKRQANSEKVPDILQDLGITRYCCRRMFVTHVSLTDEIINYTPMK